MTQTAERPRTIPEVPGVVVLDERSERLQRRMTLIVTILPLAGLALAIASLWGAGFSPLDAALAFGFYVFSGLGITVGFHRMLTHGSFRSVPWVRYGFAIAGSMAIQGSVISWVAAHRRHHAFSDQDGDPHSPHLEEVQGLKGMLRGLWHAHLGWLFSPVKTSHERWAPDLLKDGMMVKIDRAFPWLVVASFTLPAAIAFAVTQSLWAAVTAFLWATLARIFLLHHVTWSINSICHFYGKRPFRSNDHSTNNWPLAILSFGESWHNNHHAFPTSARHGILRGQFDTSALVIKTLAKLRLVYDVKEVSEKQLVAKRDA